MTSLHCDQVLSRRVHVRRKLAVVVITLSQRARVHMWTTHFNMEESWNVQAEASPSRRKEEQFNPEMKRLHTSPDIMTFSLSMTSSSCVLSKCCQLHVNVDDQWGEMLAESEDTISPHLSAWRAKCRGREKSSGKNSDLVLVWDIRTNPPLYIRIYWRSYGRSKRVSYFVFSIDIKG